MTKRCGHSTQYVLNEHLISKPWVLIASFAFLLQQLHSYIMAFHPFTQKEH